MHATGRLGVGLAAALGLAGLLGCGDGGKPDAPGTGTKAKAGAATTTETPKPVTAGKPLAGKQLELFVGSASQPATEEAAKAFEAKTGCEMALHLGGSGKMLSSMVLGKRGDLYFPGSSDFMAKAKRRGEVLPHTEKTIVYLLPAINVPNENPKGIQKLDDLAKPGVRVGIAVPDTVCVGLYAVEVLTANGLAAKVKPNIVTYAESCAKTAQIVALDQADAVLGWRVFHYWKPDLVTTIMLAPEQIPRIGYIPIAISRYCKEPAVAQAFIDFLLGEEGKAIFRKWHYLASVDEARKFTRPDTPVGGEWKLPEGW